MLAKIYLYKMKHMSRASLDHSIAVTSALEWYISFSFWNCFPFCSILSGMHIDHKVQSTLCSFLAGVFWTFFSSPTAWSGPYGSCSIPFTSVWMAVSAELTCSSALDSQVNTTKAEVSQWRSPMKSWVVLW